MITQFPEHSDIIPYQITDDVLTKGVPQEAQELLEEMHPYLHNPNRALVKELEEAIKKYPGVKPFQSHLAMVYMVLGKDLKARKVVQSLLQRHPDYLFGKIRAVEISRDRDRGKVMRKLLGERLWLHDLYPERDCFHQNEVMSYYALVIRQLITEDEIEEAVARHKIMIVLEPDSELTMQLGIEVLSALMDRKQLSREEDGAFIEPQSFNKVSEKYPPTKEVPSFTVSAVNAFYAYELEELPEDIEKELMTLPAAALEKDLGQVIADVIKRYAYFVEEEGFDEDLSFQHLEHALIFAGLRSCTNLIPTFLDFLRTGEDIIGYWLGTEVLDYSYLLLRAGFPEYAGSYAEFVREENVYGQGKAAVVLSVAAAGLQHTELREKAIVWILDFVKHLLAEANNEKLFDTQLLNMSMLAGIWLQDQRFENVLYQLSESEWWLSSILDKYQDAKDRLQKKQALQITPFLLQTPQTLSDFFEYDGAMPENIGQALGIEVEDSLCQEYYQNLLIGGLSGLMDDAFDEPWLDDDDDDFSYLANDNYDRPVLQPPTEPVKSQKIGRNEPCPCGSGKKYKHCCARK